MKTQCPHCQQHYEVDDSFLGTTVSCETCKKEFVVMGENKVLFKGNNNLNKPTKTSKSILICALEGVIILVLGIVFSILLIKNNKEKSVQSMRFEQTHTALVQTKTELVEAQNRLEQSKSELSQTKNELAKTKTEISRLQNEINKTKLNNSSENAKIIAENNSLKEANETLKNQIRILNSSTDENSMNQKAENTLRNANEQTKNTSKKSLSQVIANKSVSKKSDFMQGVTWYKPTRNYRIQKFGKHVMEYFDLYMYCGKYDNGKKSLRLSIKCELEYETDLYMRSIQIKGTDGTSVTFDLTGSELDINEKNYVVEWADISVTSSVDELRKIAKSSEIYVRIHGKYPREWKLTNNQRITFKDAVEIYDAL